MTEQRKELLISRLTEIDNTIRDNQDTRTKIVEELNELFLPKGTILNYKRAGLQRQICKTIKVERIDLTQKHDGTDYEINAIWGRRILKDGSMGARQKIWSWDIADWHKENL